MTLVSEAAEIGVRAPERIYVNDGNPPLLELLPSGCRRLLDVGCGAGDNASLVRARIPGCEIVGITHSQPERELARRHMSECLLFDIEGTLPPQLRRQRFDVVMFSHVLEHLRDPAHVLAQFVGLLEPGGHVLIAVPNILSWRMRIEFLLGRFEYQSAGVLDDTHLRFFTYLTADTYLLARSPELRLKAKTVTGSIPLWWLRRYVLPLSWSTRIDDWASARWPNLFGGQILILAVKR